MSEPSDPPPPETELPIEGKRRRGRATKKKKGEPASFAPGAAVPPKEFDAERLAKELHLWWQEGKGETFWIGSNPKQFPANDGGDELFIERPQIWSRWPESKIVNLLRMHYVRVKPRETDTLGEADRLIMYVMQNRRIDKVCQALAGYPAGIYERYGETMLVRTSPHFIDPKEGNWDTVNALINAKLNFSYNEGTGPDQTAYFHGWMKTALEGLYLGGPGNFRPGQTVILAGPRDCGKSRLQHQIITGLLGGRSADPGPYMFGKTDFNAEMFGAEHLMIEDPAGSWNAEKRSYFGEMLKQLMVNDTQRLHQKREDAVVVSPFFRLTISINDDPDKLRVLPPLTPDMKDKVILFHVSDHALPMPTSTLQQRSEFRSKVAAELPAYAWWLLNVHTIKPEMQSVRFGVKEWHHPGLATELFEDSPASELLRIIDAADFRAGEKGIAGTKLWDLKSDAKTMGEYWEGSAFDLERLLLSELPDWKCSLEREAKKLCMHQRVDRLLGRLKEDQPNRVLDHRTNIQRRWQVYAPPTG